MLIREGTIDNINVTAEGRTMMELDRKVEFLNATYGGRIDWDEDLYEKNVVASRSEVFDMSVLIPRNHSIKVHRDSSFLGAEKWLAAYKKYSAYGTSKDEAVRNVVLLIKSQEQNYV